ncbi:uncharacterized protein [Setaria viridis]|uniref:uncharacterized protein n=1 Tax=Setaria viridis TaxID=4556 RepID=UPI003B3A8B50
MAFEELLQLLASSEAVVAKQAEVMRLVMLATTESLASGEIVPGDPEFLDAAARAEALGLETLRRAAESVDKSTRMAAEYAAAPGGEAVVEAARGRPPPPPRGRPPPPPRWARAPPSSPPSCAASGRCPLLPPLPAGPGGATPKLHYLRDRRDLHPNLNNRHQEREEAELYRHAEYNRDYDTPGLNRDA